jgi:hypothetical protein
MMLTQCLCTQTQTVATNVTSLRTQGGNSFLAFAKNELWNQVRVPDALYLRERERERVVCVVCVYVRCVVSTS